MKNDFSLARFASCSRSERFMMALAITSYQRKLMLHSEYTLSSITPEKRSDAKHPVFLQLNFTFRVSGTFLLNESRNFTVVPAMIPLEKLPVSGILKQEVSKMDRKVHSEISVIILAYTHRYLFPIAIAVVPLFLTNQQSVYILYLGIGMIVSSVYDLVGYLLRWRHLYCSYQNAYHKKMTPDRICWDDIKKRHAYGGPLISAILGALLLFIYFYSL